MPVTSDQLRKALVEPGYLDETTFRKAEAEAVARQVSVETVIAEQGMIPEAYLGQLVADVVGYPAARLDVREVPDHLLRVIPEKMARSCRVVAFAKDAAGRLKIAMSNPDDLETVHLIEKKAGMRVAPHYATDKAIEQVLERYAKNLEASIKEVFAAVLQENGGKVGDGQKISKEEEGAAVAVVRILVDYAYQHRASDIHIEPHEKEVTVRYRIDGVLHDVARLPREIMDLIITRIKVLSRMRTDQHFAAQDGKFQETTGGERLDVRVSAIPIIGGEKIVMRLLTERGKQYDLADIGLSEHDLERVRRQTQKTYGMILSTGPTGSGKTTTLYSVIKVLNTRDVNIATIEDPIEYSIEGVNQIQVNPRTGLTFASGLRSIVRQDPDIIMVGEIRDEETAGIGVNAALTGHLVLSTLHTNTAATALPRLRDMKVEPFLLASTIDTIIGQRLVRRICQRCISSHSVTPEELASRLPEQILARLFGSGQSRRSRLTLYRGKGCDRCEYTGYQGRVGIFEVLIVTDRIKQLIMANANTTEIEKQAREEGMTTMLEDGLRKALSAVTTLDEVLKTMGY
jgi:type IV pilus assembly protein PilB